MARFFFNRPAFLSVRSSTSSHSYILGSRLLQPHDCAPRYALSPFCPSLACSSACAGSYGLPLVDTSFPFLAILITGP
eukprot:6190671-Pleurochrysis_carterae.AAC.1